MFLNFKKRCLFVYPNTSAITTDWRLDGVKASIAKEKQLLLALLAASRQAAHGGEGLQRPSRSPLLYSEAEALLLSLATELYLPFQYISVKNIMYYVSENMRIFFIYQKVVSSVLRSLKERKGESLYVFFLKKKNLLMPLGNPFVTENVMEWEWTQTFLWKHSQSFSAVFRESEDSVLFFHKLTKYILYFLITKERTSYRPEDPKT